MSSFCGKSELQQLEQPVWLRYSQLPDHPESGFDMGAKCSFCERILPVENLPKLQLEDVKQAASNLAGSLLADAPSGSADIQFAGRASSSKEREHHEPHAP